MSVIIYRRKRYITRVIDGDTFFFHTKDALLRIRAGCIDCPEMCQEYGQEAKNFMEQYLNEEAWNECFGADKFNRTLAKLFIKGEDINNKLIQEGLAWHYSEYNTYGFCRNS